MKNNSDEKQESQNFKNIDNLRIEIEKGWSCK